MDASKTPEFGALAFGGLSFLQDNMALVLDLSGVSGLDLGVGLSLEFWVFV